MHTYPREKIWTIELDDTGNDVLPQVFIQSYNGDEWLTFNPKTGITGLPKDQIIWKVGNTRFLRSKVVNRDFRFSITSWCILIFLTSESNANKNNSILSKLTLFSFRTQPEYL